MTARAEAIRAAADTTVASWDSVAAAERERLLTAVRQAGRVHPLKSGGFVVHLGHDDFPRWAPSEAAANRLLLDEGLAAT